MWEINNLNQISSFLYSLLLGGIFCLIFDVFRSFRKIFKISAIWVFAQDLLCFLIYAPVTFCFLLATTNGKPRFYVFLGIALGFAVTCKAVSPVFVLIFCFILRGIKVGVKFLFNLLRRLREIILDFLRNMADIFTKNCKKALNIPKKLLKK